VEKQFVSRRLRPDLVGVEAYSTPASEAAVVRLASNESPFPPSPGFERDLVAELRALSLNRYPDGASMRLRRALAERHGVEPEFVWVANGSNEILQQTLLAFGGAGRRIVTFAPTYAMYGRIAAVTATQVEVVPLDPPFAILEEHAGRAAAANPDLVVVCSPNNPTGNAQTPVAAAALAAATGALVVADEAYAEFSGSTTLAGGAPPRDVMVVRTLSKAFGMAGARVGYCVADPGIVEGLRRVALPYHLSGPAQASAIVALRRADEVDGRVAAIVAERDRLARAMAAISGTRVLPSSANFVAFRPPGGARAAWCGLRERGLLVRDVSDVLPGHLRVTAGTPAEGDRFIEALEEVLA